MQKNRKRIMLIGAHLDDIEIGAFALILDLISGKYPKVYLSINIFSSGFYGHNSEKIEARKKAFQKNMEMIIDHAEANSVNLKLNLYINDELLDTEFPEHIIFIKNEIYYKFFDFSPEILIFNSKDKHSDHYIINDIIHEVCIPSRRKNKTSELEFFEFEIPGSSFLNHSSFNYNFIYSKKIKKLKELALANYIEAGILREDGDRRSKKFIDSLQDMLLTYLGISKKKGIERFNYSKII